MTHVLRSAAAFSALLLAVACTSGREDVAAPSPSGTGGTPPTAAATPSESETVEPIAGERVVRVDSIAVEPVVLNGGQQPEVDTEAVERFARDVGDFLDAHLTDLARGGAGAITEVAAPGLLDDASPAALIAVTTALASPDREVVRARYLMHVATDGGPQWLRTTVATIDPEGERAFAEFVFVPGEGRLVLMAAGPGTEVAT